MSLYSSISSTVNEKNNDNEHNDNDTSTTKSDTNKIMNNQQKQKLQQKQQQIEYMTKVKDLKGVSNSHTNSSEFVTHFVSNENNTYTIETAIESILPRSTPRIRNHSNDDYSNNNNHHRTSNMRNKRKFVFCIDSNNEDDDSNDNQQDEIVDMSLWTKQLVDYEKQNPILQSIEAKFRHNPAFIGDYNRNSKNSHLQETTIEKELNEEEGNDQLSPAELVALGCVWFLGSDAPRDPSLGGKVRILNFAPIMW